MTAEELSAPAPVPAGPGWPLRGDGCPSAWIKTTVAGRIFPRQRGRSLPLLGTAGLAIVGTTVLSTLGASNAGSFGPLLKIVVLIASVLLNAAVFVLAFRIATARNLSVRDVAPGALGAAIVWQLLQTFGVVYVGHVVKGASATNGVFALVLRLIAFLYLTGVVVVLCVETNGVFALVLGLIAFLYLTGVVVVLCVETNVVRVDRLHPRSLLTPFTDDVVLTGGDRRAYTGQATAQRNKGFEDINVDFHPPIQ